MNFIRTPLFVNITDIHKQITEHEHLILVLKDKTASFSFRTLDIGTFFFAKRACSSDISDNELVASFDEKRRYFLKCFTDYLLQMDGSDLSKGLFYFIIKIFLDWIDQQKKNFDLSNKDSVIDAYRRYSKYLVDRTLLADTDDDNLAAHTAKQYQRYVAKLIAYVFDCHEIDISSQAMQVQAQHYDVPVLPIAQEDHQKTYATLLNVFLEIYRIVMQGADFPAHFQSVDQEDFYFYSGFHHQTEKQHIQFDMQNYLAKYPIIPALSKMLADFELEEDSEHRKRVRENRNQAIRNLEERNKDKRHLERARLASYGLAIGMLLFIAQTGANLDTAQQLQLHTMEVLPSTQGRRFSGTKSRAGGKTVYPEFGVKFEPVFRKILELREWYIQDEACDFIFPLRNEIRQLGPVSYSRLQLMKKLFQRIFPQMVWITPQQWRKHKSSQYVELSDGDLLLEAEVMGHSLDTARQNYSRTSFKDAAQQISQFFNELREVAVAQTRTLERIAVQTLDEPVDVQTLPVGACVTATPQPEKALGFTEKAPTPNCQQFEHCLFCQHYAIHADDADIRKLLSLKSLLGYVKQKATNLVKWEQQFGVVLHRIDEVLNELSTSYQDLKERILSIQDEVESGDLDAYWFNHFELLIDLGWIA